MCRRPPPPNKPLLPTPLRGAAERPSVGQTCGAPTLSQTQKPPKRIDNDSEVALTGGRLTKGVVRIGETVRRPRRDSSEFVARVSRHLQTLNVSWAPRYIGRDEVGRDMFTYLPGSVPERWGHFTDHQVRAAAKLLRALHDATRGSELCADRSAVCHHDFGPNNAVFRDQLPVAMIDFDMMAPGDALEDLGYSAWAWCISSKATRPPIDIQAHQLRILAESYGLDIPGRSTLIDAVLERQDRNARFWSNALNNSQDIVTPVEKVSEVIDWSRREAAYVVTNRRAFEQALI